MSLGLTDRIAEMNADGEMLGLRSEIALVTVEIERELKRIYSAESSDQNNTIRDLIAEHRQVLASHESDNRIITESNRVLSRLEKAIKEANRNSISLATIWPLFEVRRKLVATELQREKAMNTSFSPERAVLFVRDLGGVISRLVKDQDTRRGILVEFEKIMRR